MRVLHVIPGIAPRYGGPSAMVLSMCEALSRVPGLDVEIAATDADGPGGYLTTSTMLTGSAPIRLFRRNFSERWKFSWPILRWLWSHVRNYDILHVHAVWSFTTVAACRAARRHGVPVILMPSGMLLDYSFRRSALTKCVYWALVEKGNMAAVRRFHATSRVEGQELARLGLGVPITALPLGVDGEAWRIHPRPDELRQRCGSGARGRQIVLFLGRLHPVKGLVDLLLPAFSRLKADAFLAVVGGPDAHAPGHDKQVRAAVDRLQLRGRVALLGSVPPQERWALFDGAAVFVLPSHSENFGIVVAEAMARGCPVVVSDAVQAAEHVRAAEAGRVVPPAIDPLAEAIDAELSAPALRSQQGAHGQRYAASVLAWDRIAEQIFAMYKSVRGSAARVG